LPTLARISSSDVWSGALLKSSWYSPAYAALSRARTMVAFESISMGLVIGSRAWFHSRSARPSHMNQRL
jgi:hypothetical protein